MEGKKKSFLLYFDNCEQIMPLPDDQFSALMRTVMECARRLAEGQELDTWLQQRRAALAPPARMALGFMVENLRRDHQAYRNKCAYRAQNASQRKDGGTKERGSAEMAEHVRQLRELHRQLKG